MSGIDVTDRIRDQERLEEAQAQASIGFWTWQLDTNRWTTTGEVSKMFGFDEDADAIGVPDVLRLVHPQDRDVISMALATIAREPGATFEQEFRIVTTAGSTKWLVLRGRVHDDCIQVFGSVQDITRQKLVEEQLTELNRMKTDFVGIVAHDLQTPLTVAGGYAAFLKESWQQLETTSDASWSNASIVRSSGSSV